MEVNFVFSFVKDVVGLRGLLKCGRKWLILKQRLRFSG